MPPPAPSGGSAGAAGALIRVTTTGLRGSDLHLYEVLGAFLDAGDILGHEPMGVVEEVGPAVTAVEPGDRMVPRHRPCTGASGTRPAARHPHPGPEGLRRRPDRRGPNLHRRAGPRRLRHAPAVSGTGTGCVRDVPEEAGWRSQSALHSVTGVLPWCPPPTSAAGTTAR
ncbi:hypothetical protein EAO70_03615 [Streptomyces sp. adm13(2018)]|nr:hypothetical protein EAO70_03615 [Streptomyces sp. adm13(2018)]